MSDIVYESYIKINKNHYKPEYRIPNRSNVAEKDEKIGNDHYDPRKSIYSVNLTSSELTILTRSLNGHAQSSGGLNSVEFKELIEKFFKFKCDVDSRNKIRLFYITNYK